MGYQRRELFFENDSSKIPKSGAAEVNAPSQPGNQEQKRQEQAQAPGYPFIVWIQHLIVRDQMFL